jgi:hypothetical protein
MNARAVVLIEVCAVHKVARASKHISRLTFYLERPAQIARGLRIMPKVRSRRRVLSSAAAFCCGA